MTEKKILIIDDEETTRQIVRVILEDNSLTYLEACNGSDGLEKALQEQPDCILLDWMMPGMSGIEVLKALKHNEETENIPVIMLTGKTEINHVSESLVMGAHDYIVKPFDDYNLLKRLEKTFVA
ncbi:MAG: PleD family two-component system response regulator [Alphaproteobacteria bacterium]